MRNRLVWLGAETLLVVTVVLVVVTVIGAVATWGLGWRWM